MFRVEKHARYFNLFILFSLLLSADVDECRDRNDEDLVCDHFCHNYIGGFYCSCRYGFLLHSDNRTCKGSLLVSLWCHFLNLTKITAFSIFGQNNPFLFHYSWGFLQYNKHACSIHVVIHVNLELHNIKGQCQKTLPFLHLFTRISQVWPSFFGAKRWELKQYLYAAWLGKSFKSSNTPEKWSHQCPNVALTSCAQKWSGAVRYQSPAQTHAESFSTVYCWTYYVSVK